jgi:glycosyltransferase involved in cell wall biosynthesis
LRIAVLLPCRNEERTIAKVVSEFRAALPTASVYVYDNASTDRTVEQARAAGAIVRHEPRKGKGNVVCRMFADIDADLYVMADGDGTYDPSAAPAMAHLLVEENLDMVVGCRVASANGPPLYPRGHTLGNWLFNRIIRMLFGRTFTDVFSGYRVLSRRFVKSFPVRFTGFEIETELAAHTIEIGLPYAGVVTTYRPRNLESKTKLRTFPDGLRIMIAAILLFKEMRPLRFFTLIAAVLTTIALLLGAVVVEEFLTTGLVPRLLRRDDSFIWPCHRSGATTLRSSSPTRSERCVSRCPRRTASGCVHGLADPVGGLRSGWQRSSYGAGDAITVAHEGLATVPTGSGPAPGAPHHLHSPCRQPVGRQAPPPPAPAGPGRLRRGRLAADSLAVPICRFARAYRCRRPRELGTWGHDEAAKQPYLGLRPSAGVLARDDRGRPPGASEPFRPGRW